MQLARKFGIVLIGRIVSVDAYFKKISSAKSSVLAQDQIAILLGQEDP